MSNPTTNPQHFDVRQLFGARQVETVARALELAQDLARLGYPGADDVVAWLDELQSSITPAMPRLDPSQLLTDWRAAGERVQDDGATAQNVI